MLTYRFDDLDELILIGLSDLHIGSDQCDEKLIGLFLKKWGEIPNVRFVLAGDLVDNGLKNSKTNVYEQRYSPEGQIDRIVEMLSPYRDKILCIVDGNHEKRSSKEADISPSRLIAYELGLSKVYRKISCYLRIYVGKRKNGHSDNPVYSVAVHHGGGGAMHKLDKYSVMLGVDVLMSGHTHKPDSHPVSRMEVDINKGVVRFKKIHVVTLTGWLSFGGYGEEKMYLPTPVAPNRVILMGGNHEIEVINT